MVMIIPIGDRAIYSPVHFKLKQMFKGQKVIIIDLLYTWDLGKAMQVASSQKVFFPDHEVIIDGIGWRNLGNTSKISWSELEQMDDCCQDESVPYLVTKVSKGCPKNCEYCHSGPHQFLQIPTVNRNDVRLVDENLLACKTPVAIIEKLGTMRWKGKIVYWECLAGVDKDLLTAPICKALKMNHFHNIKVSWDGSLEQWEKVKIALDLLDGAGFRRRDLKVFVISNWKNSYEDNMEKLRRLFWNGVQIEDCWFKEKPMWTAEQAAIFRHCCRRANQLTRMGFKSLKEFISCGCDNGKKYPRDPAFVELIETYFKTLPLP